MAIGTHHCNVAGDTHLKGAFIAGLDEVLTALEESFYDLSDDQARQFPVPGRNNIAWIVMHCLDNLDDCAVGGPMGRRVMEPERRWNLWGAGPHERPKPSDEFPTVREMLDLLGRVRTAATAALEAGDEADLVKHAFPHPRKPAQSDFYVRTICHTNAHVRQIWALRGVMGLVNEGAWPRQHWA